ncbi:MAG: glycosyl hydrolase 115 family protein [Algibacter sp.]
MLKRISKRITVYATLLSVFVMLSCKTKESNSEVIYLITGKNANNIELSSINDLKKDLTKVNNKNIVVLSEEKMLPVNGIIYILGTCDSNNIIGKKAKAGIINISNKTPGARGGIWAKTKSNDGSEQIIIAGSDVQGLQYAIYDYSKEVLGVDALEYWTGKIPEKNIKVDLFDFENRTISPPQIPHLGYFENDVDELANYRGKLLEYDWESYTELINSLVRLRYNSIQLFDMLGRPEFYVRPEYKKLKSDYQIDIDYLERMIDYAHLKGMKIAIDFALGYQIHPMAADKATCWTTYKEDWLQAWRYYLEKTPLKKTDMFILRPRHQVWDWEYKSTCGENKIDVFNEVYAEFGKLLKEYKPDAEKILICYSDGMQMWNDGFRPPKDWIVAWADDGFSGFKYLPNTTSDYNFGTYMHAGFWLNHTVHDPYPKKMDTIMKHMVKNYKADKYCLVNGQQFRPFLLNIEGFSEISKSVEDFDGDLFYDTWTKRYFNDKAARYAVKAMQKLHDAQFNRGGYVEHLWEIRETVSYLSNSPIRRPGKTPIPFDYHAVSEDYEHIEKRIDILKEADSFAIQGAKFMPENDMFYNDYVVLPIKLYQDLLSFEYVLHQMAQLKKNFETTGNKSQLNKAVLLLEDAYKKLEIIHSRSLEGDKNQKWKNWYDPKIRRPNNGFPSKEMLESIKNNLANLKTK